MSLDHEREGLTPAHPLPFGVEIENRQNLRGNRCRKPLILIFLGLMAAPTLMLHRIQYERFHVKQGNLSYMFIGIHACEPEQPAGGTAPLPLAAGGA